MHNLQSIFSHASSTILCRSHQVGAVVRPWSVSASHVECHPSQIATWRGGRRADKGKEKGKCSGRKEASQFQPVPPSEPRYILPTPKNRIKLPRNERLIVKQNKLNFLPNQKPHFSCFSENTGLHDLRSSVM